MSASPKLQEHKCTEVLAILQFPSHGESRSLSQEALDSQ